MARIRTIKPEFWEDETIALLPPLGRLLFIGTWNLADDEGLLRWTPDYLKAGIFIYDKLTIKQVSGLMELLVDAGLVFPYQGGKAHQLLAYIPGFTRHQRINRPSPSKLPPPSIQSPEVRRMYAHRDRWVCHLCNELIVDPAGGAAGPSWDECDTLSLDHVKPRSKGGSDYPSNIRSSHQRCNKSKGGRVNDSASPSVKRSVSRSRPEVEGEVEGEKEMEGKPAVADAPAGEVVAVNGDRAHQIAVDFWEASDPKPAVKFIALRKIIERFLGAGWQPEQVASALRCTRAFTVDAIEYKLRETHSLPDRYAGIAKWAGDAS